MTRRPVIRVGAESSTLRSRRLGTRLRELRDAAGLRGVEVAKRMGRAHSTLSLWESGDTIPRPPDLHFMLEIYDVRKAEREALLRLAEAARGRENAAESVSVVLADYDWLISHARKVETFQTIVLPGLLQTADYARAALRAWDPAASMQRIERTLGARMARQRRLDGEGSLELVAILDEAALRRQVGSPAVMLAQLGHVIERAAQPNVEIRVVPFGAGAHASLAGAFSILRFRQDPDVVYVETPGGDLHIEGAEPFARTLRRLTKTALPARKSVAMIAAISREMT